MHQQQQTNILQMFCNMHEKMFTNSLLFYMGCFLLSVLWYDFVNKQIFPVICNNHKLLSHLKLDFKQKLTIVHVRFENCSVPQFWLGNIYKCDGFRPIMCKQKNLMDHSQENTPSDIP